MACAVRRIACLWLELELTRASFCCAHISVRHGPNEGNEGNESDEGDEGHEGHEGDEVDEEGNEEGR